jgi:hypothetical protein
MASNGFTLYGATTMLTALLASDVFGKIYTDDPEDGTMNPSSITTREPITFGSPDSNGVFDLAEMVSWGTFVVKEQVWGVGLWTAATAGNCFYLREFAQPKNMYPGDTLDLSTLPIGFPLVGQ